MTEKSKNKNKPSTQVSRKRILLVAVLFALVGCLLSSGVLLAGLMEDNQKKSLERNSRELLHLQQQARDISVNYLRERTQLRSRIEESLVREAATVCGDIQVFLQAALVKKEAEEVRRRYQRIQLQQEKLEDFARNQLKMAGALEQRIAEGTTEKSVTPSLVTVDGVAVESSDVNSFITSTDPSALNEKYKKIITDFTSEQQKKLGELDTLVVRQDKSQLAVDWPLGLLRECGLDLESLLPDNCTFTVAEAGGKLLMALGGGKATLDEVRGESSRTLLFTAADNSFHWVLRTVLADTKAPPEANTTELATLLNDRLGILSRSDNNTLLTGYIYSADGDIAAGFGKSFQDQYPPAVVDQWLNSRENHRYFIKSPPVPPKNWRIAFMVTLPNKPVKERLKLLMQENPVYAVGFAVTLVLLLTGIITVSILAWRNQSASGAFDQESLRLITQSIDHQALEVAPKPKLGSLERLQSENRGKSIKGCRILDMAQSPVLRELAKRVRGDNPTAISASAQLRKYSK